MKSKTSDSDILVDLESGGTTSEEDGLNEMASSDMQSKKLLGRVWSGFVSSGRSPVKGQDVMDSYNTLRYSIEVSTEKVELLGGEKEAGLIKNNTVNLKPKKKSDKKASKPPRPPKPLTLDAADQKLVREISELAMLKKARKERMKALKKMKASKSSSSSGNIYGLIVTIIFCLIIILQGQLLMDDHPTLFWTPCAAHCIDLMLHDICKLPIITKTVKRAIALNGYIYNHPYVLNMMRTFTEQKELIRPGVTRFATVFLTLQSIHNQKNKLRRMFTSEEWSTSRYHRDTKGKDAYETVMSVGFWNNILYSLRATGPLVRVLRLVDSEKNPTMGYIYEAMDRAKEAISKSFNYNEAKYCEIWEIIDKRWNDQLHRPLRAAGYYLNPEYFYSTPRIESNEELNEGFLKTMVRLVPDEAIQHRVETELSLYRYARGVMGSPNAIRNRALWLPGVFSSGSSTVSSHGSPESTKGQGGLISDQFHKERSTSKSMLDAGWNRFRGRRKKCGVLQVDLCDVLGNSNLKNKPLQ